VKKLKTNYNFLNIINTTEYYNGENLLITKDYVYIYLCSFKTLHKEKEHH